MTYALCIIGLALFLAAAVLIGRAILKAMDRADINAGGHLL